MTTLMIYDALSGDSITPRYTDRIQRVGAKMDIRSLHTDDAYRTALANVSALEIPTTGLREFITDLAKRHGVTYVRDGYSALAEVITRLSDNEAVPDETEKLVIALLRAEVIDGPTMVTLLGRYLDEQRERDTE